MDSSDKVRQYIREHDIRVLAPLERVFPKMERMTLRVLLAEYRREVAKRLETDIPNAFRSGTGFDIPKKVETILDAGMLRPLEVSFNWLPPQLAPAPSVGAKRLIISDMHAPDTAWEALDVAIQAGQDADVDEVIIAGDGFDVHALSRFTPSSDKPMRWVEERVKAVETPAYVRANFPDKPIYYLPGNHCLRVKRYIDSNAPQLQGLFALDYLLGLDDPALAIDTIEAGRMLVGNNILAKHGTKVSKHAGYSVKREIEDAGMSVIMGHVHRMAMVHVRTARQELSGAQPLVGVELGCLCDLNPSYLEPENTANWQHGAAIVTVLENGYHDVELIKIHEGQAVFRGNVYTSRTIDGKTSTHSVR